MSTGYFLPENGAPLRHAHPHEGKPDNKLWHDASTIHHADPIAHSINDSWSPDANWAKANRALPNAIKHKLIKEAREAHDQGAPSPTFKLPTPPDPNINLTTSTSSETPSDLLQRLNDVEELSTAAATTSNAAAEQADRIDGRVKVLTSTVDAFKAEIADLKETRQRTVRYEIYDRDTKQTHTLEGHKHSDFQFTWDLVKKAKPHRRNFWLAGPAGSGKSTLVEQIAEGLGLSTRFFPQPPIINVMTQMIGYRDIQSKIVRTDFREVYENGGVILFDECDASSPEAMVVMNQALANGVFGFPDGVIRRHKKCYIFAAANTMGAGADAQYSARFKQDDAFMDRFFTVDMDYDEALERSMIEEYAQAWVTVVQTVRQAARDAKANFVISPRASEKGADLLYGDDNEDPMSPNNVVRAIFGRYRKHEKWPHVGRAAEEFAKRPAAPSRPRTRTPNVNLNGVNFNG